MTSKSVSKVLDKISGHLVYGDPFLTEDRSTVIPVSRLHGDNSTPVGIFVVHDGHGTWVPAVDANRIGEIGVATGFVAATLACLAVLRRPPWPDVRLSKHC